ncbi:MAG: hypothetical protein Q7K03_09500 [Dehalococcoidia bacterium]|nr:hypothetical protein [Dehalococcoidia bacterium]
MDVKKAKSKTQEDLVLLYLRLNGFFVTSFIVHSPDPGRNLTEIDALAIRMPHNAEPEREIGPHELLDLSSNHTDLVICEVKSKGQQIRFNEALTTNYQAVESVLRWSGLFLDEEIPGLAERLQEAFAQKPLPSSGPPCVIGPRGVRIRCLLFSPERKKRNGSQPWYITGPPVFEYVHRCLSPVQPRPECSVTYDFGLWWSQEWIVRYFKGRKGQDAGDVEQLMAYQDSPPRPRLPRPPAADSQ